MYASDKVSANGCTEVDPARINPKLDFCRHAAFESMIISNSENFKGRMIILRFFNIFLLVFISSPFLVGQRRHTDVNPNSSIIRQSLFITYLQNGYTATFRCIGTYDSNCWAMPHPPLIENAPLLKSASSFKGFFIRSRNVDRELDRSNVRRHFWYGHRHVRCYGAYRRSRQGEECFPPLPSAPR